MTHHVPVQSLIDHIKTSMDVDPWAKEMAEELLQSQIAIDPVPNKKLEDLGWTDVYNCGKCGNQLRMLAKYCDECGTKVKKRDANR